MRQYRWRNTKYSNWRWANFQMQVTLRTKFYIWSSNQLHWHCEIYTSSCVSSRSKTDKIRVVFDAGAKYNKTCLNKHLLKGPDLLNNLFSMLMRFRLGECAAVGDIEQMLGKHVRERVYVSHGEDHLTKTWHDFQMAKHLLGKIDSSCCANYALKKTTIDNVNSNPSIRRTIENDFYMDDFLKSHSSVSYLTDTAKSVMLLLTARTLSANFHPLK